jgi:hypothetical protein
MAIAETIGAPVRRLYPLVDALLAEGLITEVEREDPST